MIITALQDIFKLISSHVYESVFIAFLLVLLVFAIYSVYFLFFEIPKTKGKKNQDFVADEVALFSEYYKKALKEEFDKIAISQKEVLDKTSQVLVASYKSMISEESEKARKSVGTVFDEIKNNVVAQVESMKKDISSDQLNIKQLIEGKLQESLDKVNSEMEIYKVARMKKLDDSIMDVVKKVGEEVLAKSLNINEHKKLIFDCLNDAKKEGVFNG